MALKAAVIGVGMMGRNHARVYAQMEGTALVAAADPDASVLEHLERAHLLEGNAFEGYYASLLDKYRASGVRDMRDPASLGLNGNDGGPFVQMLADAEAAQVEGTVRGLVAPHVDYARGAPCYASAYGVLVGRRPPDRIVVLGTNHFGRSTSVVATTSFPSFR